MSTAGFIGTAIISAGVGAVGCVLILRNRFEGILAENARLLVALRIAATHLRVAGHTSGARAAYDAIDATEGGDA